MDITQVEKANEEVVALRAQRDKDYAEYEAAGRVWGQSELFFSLHDFTRFNCDLVFL